MIRFDEELLRRGGNQLGVLATAAGLVAFFIDPVPGSGEMYLAAIGALMYLGSTMSW